MTQPETFAQRLAELNNQLLQVRQAFSLDDYETYLRFHVKALPKMMEAERCSIFLHNRATHRIWLKFGTGLLEKQIEAPLEGSIVGQVITSGQGRVENDLDQRVGYHTQVDAHTGFITRSVVCVPIRSRLDGKVNGAVQVLNRKGATPAHFSEQDMTDLEEVADLLSIIIDNIIIREDILRISGQLTSEFDRYHKQSGARAHFIAASLPMREVLERVQMVSETPVNVFLQGENGTGKELIAHTIHQSSPQRERPFVAVNCASIPETLIESEFFGYEKGAFTGAEGSRKGRFEEAEGGTLFLDEIGEMPLSIQPKFLRAIQEREGTRLGSNKVIRYNFRLISATNVDIHQRIRAGLFREDLFYRLYSVEIGIPPLRERVVDILPLATAFLEETCQRFNKWVEGYSQEVITLFERYPWPGNVRQLRQEVERLVTLTPAGRKVVMSACSDDLRRFFQGDASEGGYDRSLPAQVDVLERRLIREALQEVGGNKAQAARVLGITRQGLHKKMARFGMAVGE